MFVHHAAHAASIAITHPANNTHTHTHTISYTHNARVTQSARTSAMVLGSKAIHVRAPSAPLERCHIRHLCAAAIAASPPSPPSPPSAPARRRHLTHTNRRLPAARFSSQTDHVKFRITIRSAETRMVVVFHHSRAALRPSTNSTGRGGGRGRGKYEKRVHAAQRSPSGAPGRGGSSARTPPSAITEWIE